VAMSLSGIPTEVDLHVCDITVLDIVFSYRKCKALLRLALGASNYCIVRMRLASANRGLPSN
jgi:hypothetical protein